MRKKIVFVQAIPTPYSVGRFRQLAKNNDLEIVIFFEKPSFAHRPGWYVEGIEGCMIEIVGSAIKRMRVSNQEKGYVINGIRTIPYRLPKLIWQYKPDIIVACNATEMLFCYLLKFLLNYRIGLFVEDTNHAVENRPRLIKFVRSMIYRKADFFLPFSEDATEYVKKIGVEKNIFRSSWSIDLEYFKNHYDPTICQSIRRRMDLAGKIVFLTVSQLIPQKGILNLLRAWQQLPIRFQSHLALVIIGSGPLKKEVKDFVSRNNIPNIHLAGQIPYHEIPNYYHASDIFILPSLQDVYGIVLMEAMACRLPILTTVFTGARELVKEGRNGHLFDPTNVEEIKDVIVKVYKQRRRLKRMGYASYIMIQKYSHAEIMADMGKLLLEL